MKHIDPRKDGREVFVAPPVGVPDDIPGWWSPDPSRVTPIDAPAEREPAEEPERTKEPIPA
jgi:hypothetical protein